MFDFPGVPLDAVRPSRRCDDGRKVVVNTSGGAIRNCGGKVLCGPYVFPVPVPRGTKPPDEPAFSAPNWVVSIDRTGATFNMTENEFRFTK